ncbi:MAG: hypothetical protein ACI38Y_01535 [Candidatus Methanomethylophilaceae archaeon]
MYIDSHFIESDLRRLFGLQIYEDAEAIGRKKLITGNTDLGGRISIRTVSENGDDHVVLIRRYPQYIMLDCDCSPHKCIHIAAALIDELHNEENIDENEDDEEIIDDLESRIEDLVSDITEDSDYDEDANYYEDWEIRKYGLENNNDEVEYDYTRSLIKDIVSEVSDPDTAILLLDDLITAISKMEFDNGGFERAFDECKDDIRNLFTHIGKDTLTEILKNRSYMADSIYKEHLKAVPGKVREDSYSVILKDGDVGNNAKEMFFENGDYERYIESCDNRTDSIIRVVDKLRSDGNMTKASHFAAMLIGRSDWYGDKKIADTLSANGYREEAAEIYLRIFERSPSDELISLIEKNSKKLDTQEILRKLMDRTAGSPDYNISTLICLTDNGCASDVDGYIRDVGFSPRKQTFGSIDASLLRTLCSKLLEKGFPESSAILGRGHILSILKSKDSDRYSEAVSTLRFMDSKVEFETLPINHSAFKNGLRMDYPKLRKFWGLYNGTWR